MAHTVDLPICQCPRCGKLHKDALFGRPPTKDACLFAAAPDMLEALQHVEAIMSIVQPRTATAEYLAGLDKVRAAIAKATGEPER